MKPISSLAFTLSLLALSLLFFTWVLWLCQYGLDITDEGYYLLTLQHPGYYLKTTSYFGFPLYWVSSIFDGNVVLMRMLFLVMLAFAAWALFYRIMQSAAKKNGVDKVDRLSYSLAFSASVFVVLAAWLPTPNYNLLNLFSMLLIAIGVVDLEKLDGSPCYGAFSLICFGGILCFFAKPTSAIFIFVLFFFVLLLLITRSPAAAKNAIKGVFWVAPLFIGLFLVAIHFIAGGIELAIGNFVQGIENGNLLTGRNRNIVELLWRGGVRLELEFLWGTLITAAVWTALARLVKHYGRLTCIVKLFDYRIMACAAVFYVSLVLAGITPSPLD